MRRRKSADLGDHPANRRPAVVRELSEEAEAIEEGRGPVDQILRGQAAGEVAQDPAECAQGRGIRIGLEPATTIAELGNEPESDQASLDAVAIKTQGVGE